MDLGSLTVFLQEIIVDSIEMSFLFVGRSVAVLILVLDFLANGIFSTWKEVGK